MVYQQTGPPYANSASTNSLMGVVSSISDNYNTTRNHPSSNRACNGSGTNNMKLYFVNGAVDDGDNRITIDFVSSTIVKILFADYAEKRGVSLRSLRFAYDGQPLFLSQIGKRTPYQLGMRDQDIIAVHDASAPEETKNSCLLQKSTATLNPKIKHRDNSNSKQNKYKPHRGKGQSKQNMPKAEMTQEEFKIEVG
jgi:hypothetical protein